MTILTGAPMDVKRVLPNAIEAIEIKRFTDIYRAYRKRGYNQPNAYFLAEQRWCGRAWSGGAEMDSHWHDMELAQEDYDRHGLRYVQGPVFGGGAIGQDESERPYLY